MLYIVELSLVLCVHLDWVCALLCDLNLICTEFILVCCWLEVWCRRTDELVDGPNASHITPSALDRWEARLEELFQGRPFDMLDAALADTVTKFPVDIQVSYGSIDIIAIYEILVPLVEMLFGYEVG